MRVESVHHLLTVADVDRALAFWSGALGFAVLDRPAPWWANLSCGQGGIGLDG